MLCLTCKNPHAAAIVAGIKRIEYRGWKTDHRGPLLIHAGKEADPDAQAYPGLDEESMTFGAIIGVCEVVDCRPDGCGGYEWVLSNARPFEEPLPWKGSLGLWEAEIVV
jgi:hypothetical protein